MGVSEYTISSDSQKIDFGATGVQEVLQNIRMILATPSFSCPMDRDFAWTPDVDSPINIAQAKMAAQIVDAINKYEPRAQVVRVAFSLDELNGVLKPVVRVRVVDGSI
jgi:phage baseplate assembly protein W